jgi:hypothetical protein
MAKISVEKRALCAMILFEKSGREVVNVKIKGQEISFTFKNENTPANTLTQIMEAKFAKKKAV